MTKKLSVINILDFKSGVVEVQAKNKSLSALKRYYRNQVRENNFGVDAIYFSGEFPSVYFKAVSDFQEHNVQELLRVQRTIWNQGKVPFLYAESPTEIRIYNCFEKPRRLIEEADDLLLIKASKQAENDLNDLKKVFHKISIETGSFWKNKDYSKQIKAERRVDSALIDNLKQTRDRLYDKGNGLSLEIIHDLLLRSLFLLYLEDRGATNAEFYQNFMPRAESYFNILDDKEATYRVFEKLENSFNGNLSPITQNEKNIVTEAHLEQVKRCFWSHLEPTLFDWRIFDFKVIPIQLISEIYENFLSEEIGREQKIASGAFYTPLPLAEFILNDVLPFPCRLNSNWNIKILDPTCGSGIFLVESLNRLIDRWQFSNQKKQLTFDVVKQIVTENIFGIEKEKEAIKVAAFSIYLAMIDRLEPKTLWQNVTFPYLICDPQSENKNKQGKNLFHMSSLESGSFEDIDYDLLVGNPPFGGRKLEKDVKAYLDKYEFGSETVEAFLHRATELCPQGKIALISTSMVLFNTGRKHQNFRRYLFNEAYVEQVYNFSILRNVPKSMGRNLFASTIRPICVFFYQAQPSDTPSKIKYCAPTTALKNRLIDGIAIDPTDVKYLPREECQKPDSKIWKTSMWGSERDFELLMQLKNENPLKETISKKQWEMGVGFQTSQPLKYENSQIQELPHLEPRKIDRYYTNKDSAITIERTKFRRLGNQAAYLSPHILIRRGHVNQRLCASFIDFPASFKSIVYGIHSQGGADELKLLTAYINSNLATYLTFLSSSSWGIERDAVYQDEILDLPDLCFTLSKSKIQKILKKVNDIISIKKTEFFNIDEKLSQLETEIEQIFYNALNLSETDIFLIEDLLHFQLDSFHKHQKSRAYNPCNINDSSKYSKLLCKTINKFLVVGEISVWATIFNINTWSPLNMIVIHLNQEEKPNTLLKLDDAEVNKLLKEIEEYTYEEYAESIYFRKFIRYYKGDIIYLVKPNEKRFWTQSMALNDADEIVYEILNSTHEPIH